MANPWHRWISVQSSPWPHEQIPPQNMTEAPPKLPCQHNVLLCVVSRQEHACHKQKHEIGLLSSVNNSATDLITSRRGHWQISVSVFDKLGSVAGRLALKSSPWNPKEVYYAYTQQSVVGIRMERRRVLYDTVPKLCWCAIFSTYW